MKMLNLKNTNASFQYLDENHLFFNMKYLAYFQIKSLKLIIGSIFWNCALKLTISSDKNAIMMMN